MNLYDKIKHQPFLIAGPCIIENEQMVMNLAEKIATIANDLNLTYVFKASFDKANRTSVSSFRGNGIKEGLRILQKVKDTFKIPVTTDIHESHQARELGEVIDVLQIPAFLCRQTDLLLACGETGRIVNIKKAQFLSGIEMKHAVKKVESTGNKQIILTERGTMFGYNNLVVDFRNIVDMKTLGYPVCMDVTHSTQKPGGMDGKSGGNREYAIYLASAAAAVGVDGFFFEVHEDPDHALSDGPNMIPLRDFKQLLLDSVVKHKTGFGKG
ncbi:MAG: 3-deoxy-8-phosphooctulonate synthase [Bacteroidia bacterium]|jgi:2-dehydro-3-deoxyphosphooctonate aldolase (KDO 8-P synthase)|nr:3-deoxy-8-phosphooctulonate synthase [Bacteroidia bacterium]